MDLSFKVGCSVKFWHNICQVFFPYSDTLTVSASNTKMEARLMTSDHVALVMLSLNSSAFDLYECEDALVSFSLPDMLRIMRRGGEKVEMQVQGGYLRVSLDGNRHFNIRLLEVREEEPLPPPSSNGLTCVAKLTAEGWKEALLDARVTRETGVKLIAEEDFGMMVDGDFISLEVKWGENLIHFEKQQVARAMYALDWLDQTIQGGLLGDTVIIEFGKDYPVRITYPLEHGELVYWIAPRISE
jgi:proliferating cell nuclear antigen